MAMPSVFTDEVGSADLSITTAADWTVSTGGMPNGDNYVTGDGTVAPTYYLAGTELDLRSGDWSVECWVYTTTATPATNQVILAKGTNVANSTRWILYLTTAAKIHFGLLGASDANSRTRTSTALAINTWHHVVCTISSGGVPDIYIDNALAHDTSANTGTPQAPASTDRLFFGTNCVGDGDLTTTTRVSKPAIYDHVLTSGEIGDHYFAMTT